MLRYINHKCEIKILPSIGQSIDVIKYKNKVLFNSPGDKLLLLLYSLSILLLLPLIVYVIVIINATSTIVLLVLHINCTNNCLNVFINYKKKKCIKKSRKIFLFFCHKTWKQMKKIIETGIHTKMMNK